MCMRTNIVLNRELVEEAMRYSKARTKRALIEDALQTLVNVRAEEARRTTFRDRLRGVREFTDGLQLREGAVDLLRRDRDRS